MAATPPPPMSPRIPNEGRSRAHLLRPTSLPRARCAAALTSDDDDEITQCLATLKGAAAAPNSWLMHESFRVDDASSFTRPWFAWANSLFASLLVKLSRERPHLIGIQG